ncbi:hypothetical protein ACFQMM_12110 [Saliphagus sp. GCM10025308]
MTRESEPGRGRTSDRDRASSDRPSEPNRAPGRATRPAYSSERRTWYGHGTLARAEKPPVRRYLHDVTTVFAELAVLGLPAITLAFLSPDPRIYSVSSAMLVAWLTMTAVAAGIRGGWVRPLGTDVRGWLSLTPWLVVLRVAYYNLVLGAIAFGSPAVGDAVGFPPISLVVAIGSSALAALAFPRLGEWVYGRLKGE